MTTPASRTAKRDPMTIALRGLTRLAQAPVLDRWGLRPRAERTAFHATRIGMGTATKAARSFARKPAGGAPQRQSTSGGADLFDLTPSEEQQMLAEVVREFAAEQVRPAADDADRKHATPEGLVAAAAELGMWQLGVPESLGGLTAERSAVSGVLVAEALAHGDLGLAVACLAPGSVATAIGLWGSAEQQATYLPAFVGDAPPTAALAIAEPVVLFDALAPKTSAVRTAEGWKLTGVKSLVPGAHACELFVVGATLEGEGGPALFVVEAGATGLTVEDEPAMGLRGAQTGRVHLDGVVVGADARLDGSAGAAAAYRECVRLSRLAWAALAVGTCQAVLDYVVPYVNDRVAFGEPISHRQAVAFTVSDIATELAGARLAVLRAAGRLDRGVDATREIALARSLASTYGMQIGSDGVQLLGGHGYVREHPVERWYRDLRAVGVLEGVVLV